MNDNFVEKTSLCIVSRKPCDERNLWLQRLADVEDGILVTADIIDSKPKIFENRDKIYCDDTQIENSIGVWRWTAKPSDNDPDQDCVQSYFQERYNPVFLYPIGDVRTKRQLGDKLNQGICVPYYCDVLFLYNFQNEQYCGVLCKKDEMMLENGILKLKEDVYSLPMFVISESDIYEVSFSTSEVKKFLKSLEIGNPVGYVEIGNINKIVRDIISNQLTWAVYREHTGKTKKEWQDFKTKLEKICSIPLCREAVVKALHYSSDKAEAAIKEFIRNANNFLDAVSVDIDTFAQIAMNSELIRTELESKIEKAWKEFHATEITNAEAEVQKIKEQQTILEESKSTVLAEIEEAQSELDVLRQEIKRSQNLGEEIVKAVLSRIAEAQEDVAGFLAKLSIFISQPVNSQTPRSFNHWSLIHGENAKSTTKCSSWQETLNVLKDNLWKAGVRDDSILDMFSAFLFAAYTNEAHLFLIGPNAMEIANALALAVTGKGVGVIECYGEKDQDVVMSACKADEYIIAVKNPFHTDWLSCMPYVSQEMQSERKFMIWLHPFTEDLMIEPQGLYNYVLPVFTECFVDYDVSFEPMDAGINKKNYEEYQDKGNSVVRIRELEKLGVSRLVVKRLQQVLADAKSMCDDSSFNMEYLFAILPFAVLRGRQDILEEAIKNETISKEVKEELRRYINETGE